MNRRVSCVQEVAGPIDHPSASRVGEFVSESSRQRREPCTLRIGMKESCENSAAFIEVAVNGMCNVLRNLENKHELARTL